MTLVPYWIRFELGVLLLNNNSSFEGSGWFASIYPWQSLPFHSLHIIMMQYLAKVPSEQSKMLQKSCYRISKFFCLAELSTDSLIDWLTLFSDKCNSIMAILYFFIVWCRFIAWRALLQAAVAVSFASWLYQTFVLHSFLHKGENLGYMRHGFSTRHGGCIASIVA